MHLIFCWNVLKEKTFFKSGEQLTVVFFQFIAENNDRLELSDNNETLLEERIFWGMSPLS